MRSRRIWIVAIFLATVVGTTSRSAEAGVLYRDPVFAAWERTSDITYGAAVNSRGELQSLELDLYEPVGDTSAARPVYVWVHGGYFIRGSKTDVPATVKDYALAGWVVLSIEYRLRPELPEGAANLVLNLKALEAIAAVTDGQHDAQAAVRWARANAATYRLDPNRVAIGGHSAGAIISNSVNVNEHDPGDSGNPGPSSRVAATVVSAGGGVPVVQAQVGPNEPPILFLHALDDTIVPMPVSPPMCALAVVLLSPCEYVFRLEGGHAQFGSEVALDFLYRRVILGDRLPLANASLYPG
jgi:acetyl esterase/lipase